MLSSADDIQNRFCEVSEQWPASRAEPESLNIYWRLKSRLFEESCLFKGQSVHQGSQWLQFCVCNILKTFLC
jgi:hypothetical protein